MISPINHGSTEIIEEYGNNNKWLFCSNKTTKIRIIAMIFCNIYNFRQSLDNCSIVVRISVFFGLWFGIGYGLPQWSLSAAFSCCHRLAASHHQCKPWDVTTNSKCVIDMFSVSTVKLLGGNSFNKWLWLVTENKYKVIIIRIDNKIVLIKQQNKKQSRKQDKSLYLRTFSQ